MGDRFEICADEAWTHGAAIPNRYWCFLGGLFGTESESDALETALRKRLDAASHKAEVKWQGTTPVTLDLYCDLVDLFFDVVCSSALAYRQVFLDRSFVHVPAPGEPKRSSLDVQFLLYYQFIKHHFGLEHLPAASVDEPHEILLRLDNHSSQKHKANLETFVAGLPAQIARPDLRFSTTYVNSNKFRRLQVCDLVMGAAGFDGNKQHLRREPGQRGMTKRQKARHALARHVYDRLRQIDANERGTKVFHWFESTGGSTNTMDRLTNSVRIWKFVPTSHKINHGFRNKHLDRQGRYQGPRWDP